MIEQPVVVMGVAGCGKSSLAAALASAEGAHLIEGDAWHSDSSRAKMRRGIALTDAAGTISQTERGTRPPRHKAG